MPRVLSGRSIGTRERSHPFAFWNHDIGDPMTDLQPGQPSPPRPEADLRVVRRQVVWFYLLTLLFSWSLWLPGVLRTQVGIGAGGALDALLPALGLAGGLGPSLVALGLLARQEGWTGVKTLLRRCVRFDLGRWYVPTLLAMPVLGVLAHGLNALLWKVPFPRTGLLAEPWWIPVVFGVFLIMQVSEELGWRGYALDRLQVGGTALGSSLLLGSLWALWHGPMFLTQGFGHHDQHLPFGHFFLTLVLVSILITWLQNQTHGSLVPAFVLHAYLNLTGEVLPLVQKQSHGQGDASAWTMTNLLLLCSVLGVVRWGSLRRKSAPLT